MPSSQPIFTTFLSSFVSVRAAWGASSCLQVSPRKLAWGNPGLGCVRVSLIAVLEEDLGTGGCSTGRAPCHGSWGVEDSHRSWGRQPLPSGGRGCLWLMVVQCWGRKSMQVWSLEASPSPAFQFSYTAVFGAYTAFLFIRTGWSSVSHGSPPPRGSGAHRSGWENGNAVCCGSGKFLPLWSESGRARAFSLVRSERWKRAAAVWCVWAVTDVLFQGCG